MKYHMILVGLLPFLLTSEVNGSNRTVTHIVPMTKNLTWHAAHPSEIDCRYVSRHPVPEWSYSSEIRAPELVFGSAIHVEGWLCHKVKLITRCSVTWYLSSAESHLIEDMIPDFDECRAELKRKNEIPDEEVEFPLPNCGWNAENDESVIKLTLTPHKVYFDPTTSMLKDSLIPGGSCRSDKICRTIYKSTIWIADEQSFHEKCGNQVTRNLIFKSDKNGTLPRFFVPGSGTFGISDFCIGHICEQDVVITSFGEAFIMKRPLIDRLIHQGARRCDKAHMESGSRADVRIDVMRQVEDQVSEMKCEMVITKIRSNIPLTPADMYAIAPKTTGLHPVFRVVNGTFQASHAQYVVATKPTAQTPDRQCYLAESQHYGLLESDYWMKVDDVTKMTYGGILCIRGKWALPMPAEVSSALSELDVRPWMEEYHPSNQYDMINGTSSLVSVSKNEGDNLIHATGTALESGLRQIGHVFSGFFNSLMLLIPVGGCIFMICCTWYCCSCVSQRKKSRAKADFYLHEMEALANRKVPNRRF